MTFFLVSLVLKKIKVAKLDNYEKIYYNISVRVVNDKFILWLDKKNKTYVNYRTHIALDNIDTYYDFIDANTNGTLKEYLLS